MKINTDGVLLGALATAQEPASILDIGTGTGVIALMLAQRFAKAMIDAVEIDESAALTAKSNFENSPFTERLTIYASDFEAFFATDPERKYDLIVSNPPFYINSLQSPGAKKTLAKHADEGFFNRLIGEVSRHLTTNGICWLILPPETGLLVKHIAVQCELYLQKTISVHSFETDEPHREILVFGLNATALSQEQLIIYEEPKVYSRQYQELLRDFLIIF